METAQTTQRSRLLALRHEPLRGGCLIYFFPTCAPMHWSRIHVLRQRRLLHIYLNTTMLTCALYCAALANDCLSPPSSYPSFCPQHKRLALIWGATIPPLIWFSFMNVIIFAVLAMAVIACGVGIFGMYVIEILVEEI